MSYIILCHISKCTICNHIMSFETHINHTCRFHITYRHFTYTYRHICTYTYMCYIHASIYMCVCTHSYMCTYIHTCVYIYIHLCINIYIYICHIALILLHTHTCVFLMALDISWYMSLINCPDCGLLSTLQLGASLRACARPAQRHCPPFARFGV